MGSSAISKELPQEMGGSMTKTQAVTNLVALEERCGPLCHFDKPVKIDEGEFMGHVTAKVVFLSLLDQKFFSHFMTRSFSLTSWPEVFLSLLDQNMHPRWIAPRCSLWKMSLLPQVRNCTKSQLWEFEFEGGNPFALDQLSHSMVSLFSHKNTVRKRVKVIF